MSTGLKLQVVTRFLPVRGEHGGCSYLRDILEYFKEAGWTIECLYLNEAPAGESLLYKVPQALNALCVLRCPGNLRVGSWLIRFRGIKKAIMQKLTVPKPGSANGAPGGGGADRPVSEREIAFAAAGACRFRPDAVMATYTFLAGVLPDPKPASRPVRVILAPDILHERVKEFARLGLSSAWSEWTAEKEAGLLALAELLIAISKEEGESLRRMHPGAEVVVAPMSARIPASGERALDAEQIPGRCLFVGGADAHNVHGLKWFLEDVWPAILARRAEAWLHVCGSVREGVRAEFPRVAFLGHVPDLACEYAAAEVCLVPILAGSGIKIKLVEALTLRRACVTTSHGLRGLEFLRGGVTLADGAAEFADAVAHLLTHKETRQALERKGWETVVAQLSPEKCYGPVLGALEKLVKASKEERA